jgi:hypothetical protein
MQSKENDPKQQQTPAPNSEPQELRSSMKFFVWFALLFAGVIALGMMDG